MAIRRCRCVCMHVCVCVIYICTLYVRDESVGLAGSRGTLWLFGSGGMCVYFCVCMTRYTYIQCMCEQGHTVAIWQWRCVCVGVFIQSCMRAHTQTYANIASMDATQIDSKDAHAYMHKHTYSKHGRNTHGPLLVSKHHSGCLDANTPSLSWKSDSDSDTDSDTDSESSHALATPQGVAWFCEQK
jgi:hypothetical protein